MLRTRSLTLNLFKVTLCCSHRSSQSDHVSGARSVNQCLPSLCRRQLNLVLEVLVQMVEDSPLVVLQFSQSSSKCCRQREDLQELERLEDRADGRLDPCVAWHCRHLLCISSVCGWSPWFQPVTPHLFFLLALSLSMLGSSGATIARCQCAHRRHHCHQHPPHVLSAFKGAIR